MKRNLIIGLLSLSALSYMGACTEDNIIVPEGEVADRLFTPLFRNDNNTNKGDNEPYACKIDSLNIARLRWFGVNNAAAYQIRVSTVGLVANPEGWEKPENWLIDSIVSPDVLAMDLRHLEYFTDYRFAIRALDSRGYDPASGLYDENCPHHSKWFGHGGGRQWADYLGMSTAPRYEVPDVIDIEGITDDSFRVTFDLSYDGTESYLEYFDVDADGNYVAQAILVEPAPSNPGADLPAEGEHYGKGKKIMLTKEDYARKYINVTGLSKNSSYVVNIINLNNPVKVDAVYNTLAPRTTGPAGEPILIECTWETDTIEGAHTYKCRRIDDIITNFNNDNSLPEGQIFNLEGGKNYYIYTHTNIMKGFTLQTDPEDVAKGKRAKVFLGGIDRNGTSDRIANWNLGMNQTPGISDAPILVGNVKFENIDFEVPLASNYGAQLAGERNASGNYFANMFSQGLAVTFSSFEIRHCSFQGLIRGFIRVQGQRRKVFDHLIIDDCIFWNCMYYNNDGRGYAWFASDGNPASGKSNVYRDCQFTNSTIIDCPNSNMFTDNNKNLPWPTSVKFSIKLENNTILNYNTRNKKNSSALFGFNYIPNGSTFTVRNNLFVQAKDPNDPRAMNLFGCVVDKIVGEGADAQEITVDFKDNYGVNWDPDRQGDDEIFTGSNFSGSSKAFGGYSKLTPGVINGVEELKVKASGLFPSELFVAPNPPHFDGDPRMHNRESLDGMFYKSDAKVTNSDVYKKNIGDQRWKRGTLW